MSSKQYCTKKKQKWQEKLFVRLCFSCFLDNGLNIVRKARQELFPGLCIAADCKSANDMLSLESTFY